MVQEQRVAIVRGLGHFGCTDGATGTTDVIDHHGHGTQGLAQGFRQITRHAIGGATRREWHDEGDGFVFDRIVSRLREAGHGHSRQHGQAFEQLLHDPHLHFNER